MGSAPVRLFWIYSKDIICEQYPPINSIWRLKFDLALVRHKKILDNYHHHFIPCWKHHLTQMGSRSGVTYVNTVPPELANELSRFYLGRHEIVRELVPVLLSISNTFEYDTINIELDEKDIPGNEDYVKGNISRCGPINEWLLYNDKWYVLEANGGLQIGFANEADAIKFKFLASCDKVGSYEETWLESL